MYRLRKITELKDFRFFRDYKWDENNCRLFDRNNIVYGWNGSGKTSLCDLFRELEIGQLSNNNTRFTLLFQDEQTGKNGLITQSNLNIIPYTFRVFHQDYIRENIEKIDQVKHIFSIGKEQKDRIGEIQNLREKLIVQETTIKEMKQTLESEQQSFEKFKVENAKAIKDAAVYTNAYNKNKFYQAYQHLERRSILPDDEYQKMLAAVRAEPRPIITSVRTRFIQPTVIEYINAILSETPVNITIESLKQDAAVNGWVEQGLDIHERRGISTCLFCGNPISEGQLEKLRGHFNKSYKELSEKIDGTIKLLLEKKKQFDETKMLLPEKGLFYAELQKEYELLYMSAQTICGEYSVVLSKVIDLLKKKKSNMISEEYVNEFSLLIAPLSFDFGVFEQISQLIDTHNAKTNAFNENIAAAQQKIEIHLISECADKIAKYERTICEQTVQIDNKQKNIGKLKEQIGLLEHQVRNTQIPADAINRDIEFIMGRNELVFTNTEFGYKITRMGNIAENLSTGEKNAIALIYFFNTLLDIDVDIQNTIVVLDDPISSFDSNFYYNAISYIREKTEKVGQLFIFTHKFSLLKDFSKMYNKEVNKYMIQRLEDSPQLINEDKLISQYHDEYAYLFKKIYDFVKEPPTLTGEYLQYPNMARRLLEGFLTFKLPLPSDKSTMIDKVLELEKSGNTTAGRAILRLLNNQSHFKVIQDGDLSDDIDNIAILPDILRHLLEFMKFHDPKHYNTLAAYCDGEYDAEGDVVPKKTLPPTHMVKLYGMAASAGLGNFLDDAYVEREISVANPECTFAVRISGDSMEPQIMDGSIALVKQCDVVPSPHVGVVWYRGEVYCKKLVQTDKNLLLISINKNYPPIEVFPDEEEFHVFGEVIEYLNPKDVNT